jgi:hypothetical protein
MTKPAYFKIIKSMIKTHRIEEYTFFQ